MSPFVAGLKGRDEGPGLDGPASDGMLNRAESKDPKGVVSWVIDVPEFSKRMPLS